MSDVLQRICADKREHVARCKQARPLTEVEAAAKRAGSPRGFRAALERRAATSGWGLICEIKKASPSKGLIRADFDPPALAVAYEAGGAACLSVLTDGPSFQGDDAYLTAARDAVSLPAIRKDFLVDPWQVAESRALGADAILIIMAMVDDALAGSRCRRGRFSGDCDQRCPFPSRMGQRGSLPLGRSQSYRDPCARPAGGKHRRHRGDQSKRRSFCPHRPRIFWSGRQIHRIPRHPGSCSLTECRQFCVIM